MSIFKRASISHIHIFFHQYKDNNENHSDHKHVICPGFCVIKKMLPPIALTPQGEFIEANKACQH